MTKKELEQRLETIADKLWDLKMIDHWTACEFSKYNELTREKDELQRKLALGWD